VQDPIDSIDSSRLETTSSRLLQRLRAKDPASWYRLTELYGPLVYYWCRQFGLQAQDAADVLQEVFSAVWLKMDGFCHSPGQGRFRGWLWTIARNKVRDHFRRGTPIATGGTDAQVRWASMPEQIPDPAADPSHQRELKGVFRRALELVRAEFEDRTWQAFWQVTVGGRATDDVAADLGLSPCGVRQAKSRVLRRLREEMGDLVD